MIGRFLAACAISMSDFGFSCCEAGMASSAGDGGVAVMPRAGIRRMGRRSSRDNCVSRVSELMSHWRRRIRRRRPSGRRRLHARDLEAAVGADHGEAVGLDLDDLAHLAGDALGILRRQRLGVENLAASCRRASSRRRAPDCSRGSGGRSAARACPSRCGRCRRRSGLRRWPCVSSCLMRGALPAFTRSTASSIASTPIGNSRSK